MKTLKNWKLNRSFNEGVELLVDECHLFSIYVLEEGMMRILIQKNRQLALDRTWSIAPIEDVPMEGRSRLSLEGFSCPLYTLEQAIDSLSLSTQTLKVVVSSPLSLTWYHRHKESDAWVEIAKDRHTSAYQLGRQKHTEIAHFQARYDDEKIFGLGEKAGNIERTNRKYEMRNLDAMGYDAELTDPLYKHVPFTITYNNAVSYGLFYDNLSSCHIDLGNEIDNYHPKYRKYHAESGDLDYYFFIGPKILDVTQKIVRLTGKTIFMPKWSLGYSGSTMSYTDAPDAQHQLQNFLTLCKTHHIPCDSFQMSSGYTSIGDKRYVFNWNTEKFHDFKELSANYHHAGVKLVANIKPCLLNDHPQYDALKAQGLFVQDSEQDLPELSSFWDGEGSHVDFTNPEAIKWWQKNIQEQLLEKGIDATWNDNNEYEVWDRDARCHGFGQSIEIKNIRPIMPLLMMRASKEAQEAFNANERPYLISRSGCLGMQRYVQTWSGDNRTHWRNLKFNIKMGLGMSLSGLYNIGHDVGGFSGPKPDPELFVRWVQNGVMHPRFTIHSWNDDHTANEPWMHPDVLPHIQSAMALRYQLTPYLYNLLWRAHQYDEPILRPTFMNYEHDPRTFIENDDFLLGDVLLVASVVEKGATQRSVYLPKERSGWYDFYTQQWYEGEQEVRLAAPLDRLPLLVKGGSVIPMSDYVGSFSLTYSEQRMLKIFPHRNEGKSQGVIFDDDGLTHAWKRENKQLLIEWTLTTSHDRIDLNISAKGKFIPAYQSLQCILPSDERRDLYINNVLSTSWDVVSLD